MFVGWLCVCRYANGLKWAADGAAAAAEASAAEATMGPAAAAASAAGMKSEWRGHNKALPVQLTKEEQEWISNEAVHAAQSTSTQDVLCTIKPQRHGDLFYIPTGLPHSVANGQHSILKVAFDIVDPSKPDIMARNAVIQKKIISPMMGNGQAEDYSGNTETIHTEVGNQVTQKLTAHNISATERSMKKKQYQERYHQQRQLIIDRSSDR